jgi:hypothetical protein
MRRRRILTISQEQEYVQISHRLVQTGAIMTIMVTMQMMIMMLMMRIMKKKKKNGSSVGNKKKNKIPIIIYWTQVSESRSRQKALDYSTLDNALWAMTDHLIVHIVTILT